MAQNRSRFKQMEIYITEALMVALSLFIIFLFVAGAGIIWLKVILCILIFAITVAVIGFLFLCGEILRKRSRWMSVSAASLFICTLASLLLNYPSPA